MAFEQITKFIVLLDLRCKQMKVDINQMYNENNTTRAAAMQHSYWGYFYSLLNYYETVLQTPKFRYQREYCKRVLIDLEPAFCSGYFKKAKA